MKVPYDLPMPQGMAWNMVVDPAATLTEPLAEVTYEQLWDRLDRFLAEVLPVAEAAE